MSVAAGAMPGAVAARPATNKWLVTVSVTFGTIMGARAGQIVQPGQVLAQLVPSHSRAAPPPYGEKRGA